MRRIINYKLDLRDVNTNDQVIHGFTTNNIGCYLGPIVGYRDTIEILFEDNVLKNVLPLDKSTIQDKIFYRYPNLTLPRQKIDLLKEKYNISITRGKDKADYKIVSLKYLESLSKTSWSSLYTVSDMITAVESNKNYFDDNTYDTIINDLQGQVPSTLICINVGDGYRWNSTFNITDITKNILSEFGSYNFVPSDLETDFNEILLASNIVLDSSLNDIIYEGLHTLTHAEYLSSRDLIRSEDRDNRTLALELLANCNLNKSFDYVSMLYYFYYDYLKDTNNWNNVNVKTLKTSLKEFTPSYNKDHGRHYNTYLKKLAEADQLSEFAFKECARYAYHNVIKKSMGLDSESLFNIELSSIKLNPEYISKLKED